MRAGRLKNAITIDRRVETVDRFGTPSDTWITIARLHAEILSSDTKTFLAEAGEQTETAIVFRVRYRDGIEPGDRATLGEREFDLAEIKTVVPRRVLELRCTGGKS